MKKTAQSFLHLPLNEISYATKKHWTTPDLGTSNEAPLVFGNPQFIHDPELGTCIKFDGKDDFIELPSLKGLSISNGITIAAWVRPEVMDEFGTILSMHLRESTEQTGDSQSALKGATLLAVGSEGKLYFNAEGAHTTTRDQHIPTGTWFHVAMTFAAPRAPSLKGEVTTYINGKRIHHHPLDYYSKDVVRTAGQFCAGSGSIDKKGSSFKGCMAHLRVDEKALSEDEIIKRMQTDRNEMARFRSVYPLDFELYSAYKEDQVKVLYLESPGKGEPLELAISNTTQSALTFANFIENIDKTHYHIQLRFRKNVIAPAVLAALRSKDIKLEGVSEYVVSEIHDSTREDWISLRWAKKHSLNVGQTDVISIPEFSAASRGGARNTRIEVRFANLQLGTARETKLDGSVIRHMEIQSHLGLKTLPLFPTIIGSNTILNDGVTRNELIIQIRNTNPEKPISFNNRADHPEAPSRFELVVRPDLFEKKYAGKESTELVMAASTTADGLEKHREDGADVLVNQFTFTDNSTPILGNGSIALRLENWVTKAATGAHYLNLRYKNIPGYQDGEWIVPVLMGPMLIRNIDDESRVGIGTDNPKAKLHVKGKTLIDSESGIETPQTQADLHVHGLVEIKARSEEGRDDLGLALNVNGDAKFSDELDSANLTVSKTLRFGGPTKHKELTGIVKGLYETYIERGKHNGELHISAHSKGKLIINDIISGEIDQELMSWDTSEVVVSQELTVKGNIKSTGRIEDQTGLVMPVGSIIAYAGNIREWKDYKERLENYQKELFWYKRNVKLYRWREFDEPKEPIPPALPKGWLACDGQKIDKSEYPLLYAAVGEKTPDLQGKFIVGAGEGHYEPIDEGGSNTVTLNRAQMPSHQHFSFGENYGNAWSLGKSGTNVEGGSGDINHNNAYYGTTYAGGSGEKENSKTRMPTDSHENRPPYYALIYIIKC